MISLKTCFSLNSLVRYPQTKKKEHMKITKTVIPAAGLGTRFLPYTKTIAKEMIPLGNKPAIQYIIEEGMQSDIHNFYIIINKEKEQIHAYFSHDADLEKKLIGSPKLALLESVNAIEQNAHLHYIEQQQPLGLGHAVMMAQQEIHNEYFAIMLPDDIFFGTQQPGLAQLITVAQQHNASVIAIQEVPQESVNAYGIIAVKQQLDQSLFEVDHLVEKPQAKDAPSNLAIIGRYILSPKIFDSLKILEPNHGKGELQLTDAIAHMLQQKKERVLAYKMQGVRHDIGTPAGWSKTIIDMVEKKIIV